ncbi:MAG: peptide chain release factor-like protein [Phycisphaerales bacterium]|nr:peptide chain release factor-like protein [Phycisphaerales bacterium]
MEDFFGKPVVRDLHPAALDSEALFAQCQMTRGKTSGPGGQHRNKVQTQVVLLHSPTGISAQAGERREPEVNKRVALRRLRLELAVRHRVGVPAGDIRSELWRERCRNGKIGCGVRHADFPSILAEALDVTDACAYDIKKAALRLDVSMSQMVKLFAKHPPALAMVNRERESRGLHPMRG